MTTRQRIVRSLNTRSASGAIGVAEAKFSTGWSSATGTLISDDTLVETALKLISTKLVRGDRLESPRATRQYLSLRFASLEHEVFCCLWLDLCRAVRNVEYCGRAAANHAVFDAFTQH